MKTVAQSSIEELIGELQGLATASRRVGNHAIGDSIGQKASQLLTEVRQVFAKSEPVSAPQESAVPQEDRAEIIARELMCWSVIPVFEGTNSAKVHACLREAAALLRARHAPQPGGGGLREAAHDAAGAMDALIILGEQHVPAPYKPLKERYVRDRLKRALSTPSRPPSGPSDSEMPGSAKGIQKTIFSCLEHWKNELEIEGRKPPSHRDMAFLAGVLIYGCRRSAITAAMQAANKEDKS